MRILFLTFNYPPEHTGAATRVYERACYWVRWGHEVTVITRAPTLPDGTIYEGHRNRWYHVEESDGIRVVRVKTVTAANVGVFGRVLGMVSFMLSGFVAGLFQRRPGVVVATSPHLFTTAAGWALGAIRRLPFVFELADLWPAAVEGLGAIRFGAVLRAAERLELFLYHRAAVIVALTDAFERDLVERGVPAGKIRVIRNGVDLARYRPLARDAELAADLGVAGFFVVGYLGTHGVSHALENVLDAAERLREQPRIRFLFVGSGAARPMLIESCRDRGLLNVLFVPTQPKERMAALWSICDVALVHLKDAPILRTVIPAKLFEAMGMGLPVLLCAPAGEASGLLARTSAGVWIPPEDPDSLANAVIQLEREAAWRQELADASRKAAPAHSRERQAALMLQLLEETVRR